MSLPLPLFPFRTRENRNRNRNLACQNVFLDCDERFDIYQVKAVERPHLLHFTAAKDRAVNMEDGHQDREVQAEESSKENEHELLPIVDGCDLPGWRKEGFVPFASSAIQSVLNVGAACSFFRRDRQWPVLPSNYETGARDDCIACTTDQERSSNRSVRWKELKYKFKHIPPKPKHDAMVLDNAIYSEMMEVSHSISNIEGPKRMATKFALEIEQANIPAKIMGGTKDWKCMPKYNPFDDSNSTTTDQKEKENILNDFTGGGRGGWTFANLMERYEDICWRFSDTHGEMMALSTYAKYITSPEGLLDDSPLGIYDAEFGDDDSPTHEMIKEYEPPTCFSPDLFQYNIDSNSTHDDDEEEDKSSNRPPWRWILIGPERSGTGLHVDPLWTNAWVTVLQGLKRWVLFPPHVDKERIGMIENQPQIPSVVWFRDYYDLVTSDEWPNHWKPVEVLQKPGETVFVPNGWPHLVLNLELTVAVTHNYASEFGPFERMWKQVEQDEPGFARMWYEGMVMERPDLIERIRSRNE